MPQETRAYWVTFRIREDATGAKRRAAMVDQAMAINRGRWLEPTSFMLLEAPGPARSLAAHLAKHKDTPLLADRDLLVVSDLQGPTDSAYFGSVSDLTVLKSFMPLIQKVG